MSLEKNTTKPRLDFVGIGFTKAGSTWIYKLLEEHPEICMSKTKETNFFYLNKDLTSNPKKLNSYKDYYWHCQPGQIRGEFSSGYANQDIALKQLQELYPDIKLIVALRNPVSRSVSSFFHQHSFDREVMKSDIDSILKEKYKDSEGLMYSKALKKWLEIFPREKFFVVVLEELSQNPTVGIQELYSFLGVDSNFIPQAVTTKTNAAHTYYFPRIQKVLKNTHSTIKKHPTLSKFLKRIRPLYVAKEKLNQKNRKPYKKPEISPNTKEFLKQIFKKETEELEKILKIDLSLWK